MKIKDFELAKYGSKYGSKCVVALTQIYLKCLDQKLLDDHVASKLLHIPDNVHFVFTFTIDIYCD